MRQLATVTMTMRDLDLLKCIQAVSDGDLKPGRAAERPGMSVRQIARLALRYRAEGHVGLISRHRHRTGNRTHLRAAAEQVPRIQCGQYPDLGPTLACDKFRSRHQFQR
jgi:hypothetical protein